MLCALMTCAINAAEVVDSQDNGLNSYCIIEIHSPTGPIHLVSTINNCVAASSSISVCSENKVKKKIPSLQKFCIAKILCNPREYIKRDAEHKLNQNVQNTMREMWYSYEIIRKLGKKEVPFSIQDPSTYCSLSDFFSEKIPLSQLLLFEASINAQETSRNKEEKLTFTRQEHEIFNGMLPALQDKIKPYITTWWNIILVKK